MLVLIFFLKNFFIGIRILIIFLWYYCIIYFIIWKKIYWKRNLKVIWCKQDFVVYFKVLLLLVLKLIFVQSKEMMENFKFLEYIKIFYVGGVY